MDYLFGTMPINGEQRHTLRIKAAAGESLPTYDPGTYHTHIDSYPDVTLTDSFKVERKIQETTDSESNRYVWYELSEYTRNIDRSPAAEAKATADNDATNAKLDYVAMMADVDIPEMTELGGDL